MPIPPPQKKKPHVLCFKILQINSKLTSWIVHENLQPTLSEM